MKKLIALVFSSLLLTAPAMGQDVRINEIRIDQPGTDDDEYIELAGQPSTSLAGLSLVVIGDGSGGSGVIDPTSAKPKPSPSRASGTSPFLSKPAAIPTGLGKASPATSVASGPGSCGRADPWRMRSAPSARPCARSASSRNSAGRIRR